MRRGGGEQTADQQHTASSRQRCDAGLMIALPGPRLDRRGAWVARNTEHTAAGEEGGHAVGPTHGGDEQACDAQQGEVSEQDEGGSDLLEGQPVRLRAVQAPAGDRGVHTLWVCGLQRGIVQVEPTEADR